MVALSELTLEDLLPHRPPMLLVGEIVAVTDAQAETLSTVKADWPMTSAYGVDALVCIELAAQTAGVCGGWERVQDQGLDSDQSGWLVAVKRAEFRQINLAIGSVIRTRTTNTLIFDKFREVSGQCLLDDRLIAEVTLQLYQA